MSLIDKAETPQKISKVLKAEILYLLNNYFDLTADSIDLELVVGHTGEYILSVSARSKFLKVANVITR
jgi:hypothetical protein